MPPACCLTTHRPPPPPSHPTHTYRNLSIPLWATHKPGECTHWCSPSAYHAWLYRLNALLAEAGLGNPVHVPERHAAAAAEAAAVAAAEAAAAAGAGVGLHGFD